MNTSMLIRVRQHFNSEFVPSEINRANQRKWVRSIRQLGTKWHLHPANATTKAAH